MMDLCLYIWILQRINKINFNSTFKKISSTSPKIKFSKHLWFSKSLHKKNFKCSFEKLLLLLLLLILTLSSYQVFHQNIFLFLSLSNSKIFTKEIKKNFINLIKKTPLWIIKILDSKKNFTLFTSLYRIHFTTKKRDHLPSSFTCRGHVFSLLCVRERVFADVCIRSRQWERESIIRILESDLGDDRI